MIALGPELERVTRVAPFGFQLWDPATARPVSAGLRVLARDRRGTTRAVTPGPGGVFAIRDLPIGSSFTGGAGDDAFWKQPPDLDASWTIEGDDPLGRFLPFRFAAEGAMRIGNAAVVACRLPPDAGGAPPNAAGAPLPRLPLFSAPSRPAPAGMATISAGLATTSGASPAGVLLEVRVTDTPVYGLADRDGQVTVHLPWPSPEAGNGNPPVAPRRPLAEEHWDDVRIRAFRDPQLANPTSPDLCDVLAQLDHHEVAVLAKRKPSGALQPLSLEYGKTLVVRSADMSVALLDTGTPPGP